MEKIIRSASAGTLESSDVLVQIMPAEELEIRIESVVAQQFGAAIEETVRQVLREQQVEAAFLQVMDRGALDCVLRARVETAVKRGREQA